MGNEERGKGDKKKVRRKGPDSGAMGGWELLFVVVVTVGVVTVGVVVAVTVVVIVIGQIFT